MQTLLLSLKKRTSNIRNIVVPLIEENDFWYYQIENPSFETFYRSLSEIADSAVYRVKPYNEDEEENNIPIKTATTTFLNGLQPVQKMEESIKKLVALLNLH